MTAKHQDPFYQANLEMPDELFRWIVEEARTGFHREAVLSAINNKRQGIYNREVKHRSLEGLGRLRLNVDPTSYHFWGTKLGYECWRDKQFLREYERDNPAAKVDCGGTRLQVGFGSAPSNRRFYKAYSC